MIKEGMATMSLGMTPNNVKAVLLADGWHHVSEFTLGPSPFGDGAEWFAFTEALDDGRQPTRLAGPVSTIVGMSAPAPRKEPAMPPWCGQCEYHDRAGRMVSDADGRRTPCPRCHPDPEAWAQRQKELAAQQAAQRAAFGTRTTVTAITDEAPD
ncbi:hypothetical protein [Streptomyces sp. NPDC089919]|uniref:hypothetical protein n=1 Tax=Streptomyces sp. NPDC089919 TaxID=3155188 RepID=UPI0034142A64